MALTLNDEGITPDADINQVVSTINHNDFVANYFSSVYMYQVNSSIPLPSDTDYMLRVPHLEDWAFAFAGILGDPFERAIYTRTSQAGTEQIIITTTRRIVTPEKYEMVYSFQYRSVYRVNNFRQDKD